MPKKNVKIWIEYDCPACHGEGKIRKPVVTPDAATGVIQTYEKTYCTVCRGAKRLTDWVDKDEVIW